MSDYVVVACAAPTLAWASVAACRYIRTAAPEARGVPEALRVARVRGREGRAGQRRLAADEGRRVAPRRAEHDDVRAAAQAAQAVRHGHGGERSLPIQWRGLPPHD